MLETSQEHLKHIEYHETTFDDQHDTLDTTVIVGSKI